MVDTSRALFISSPMRRIEIKQWNGQFSSPKVIEKIRRKIAGAIHTHHTVLIDFEDVKDIPHGAYSRITEGWNEEYVKIAGKPLEK